MCSNNVESTPVLLGASQSLFGIRTMPHEYATSVGVVMLNAGLLHHVGPFRLHVEVAGRLAGSGFTSLRLDQSGKGESPRRPGRSRSESLLLDYDDVQGHFAGLGINKTVLVGLCSGADDALFIASQRNSIAGLILLDGYASKNTRYRVRHYANRIFRIGPWLRAIRRLASARPYVPDINFREWESDAEMLRRFADVLQGDTRVLSVFTAGQNYYNHLGQLESELPDSCDTEHLEEVYFDKVDHTYNVTYHRLRLLDTIAAWVEKNFPG